MIPTIILDIEYCYGSQWMLSPII